MIVVADEKLETPHLEIQRLREPEVGEETKPSYQRITPVEPAALPQMLAALDATITEPFQIVVAGPMDDRGAHDLLRVIRRNYLPNKVVLRADGAEGQTWLTEQVEAIRQMHPVDGKSAAYVCRNFACELPVTESEMLEEQLRVKKLRAMN